MVFVPVLCTIQRGQRRPPVLCEFGSSLTLSPTVRLVSRADCVRLSFCGGPATAFWKGDSGPAALAAFPPPRPPAPTALLAP
jgi:hypothetical protein